MRFGSVCSGIEAASVAWKPLGWHAAWFSEIDPFACAVLAHHYPDVPNYGDMRALAARIMEGEIEAPDLLCGGTPCQAFSVAGQRGSLADERGNLTLQFVEIANAIDAVRGQRSLPRSIVFWENVPGVLNTRDNAFGCFLAGLAGERVPLKPPRGRWTDAGLVLGPKRTVAWRVLDAQYFGLAQRRRRVFLVASARSGFDPAQVLFEFEGVRRDTAPRRETRQVAPTIPARRTAGGGLGTDFECDGGLIDTQVQYVPEVARCIATREGCSLDYETTTMITHAPRHGAGERGNADVCHTLRGEGFDASEDGTGRGTPLVLHPTQDPITGVDVCHSLGANKQATAAVALRGRGNSTTAKLGNGERDCLRASDDGENSPHVLPAARVRRLMPVECERLMGFPDGYTAIPWRGKPPEQCPDGLRYKAIGNSWAVPVVRWIGKRISAALLTGPHPPPPED